MNASETIVPEIEVRAPVSYNLIKIQQKVSKFNKVMLIYARSAVAYMNTYLFI